MTPACAFHDCHGTLQLRSVGATEALWVCRACDVEHVQPVTVVAESCSGHGAAGARKFVRA